VNILGINGFAKNSSACILRDGELVSFVEKERFTRNKGNDVSFPSQAVAYCLSHAKLGLQDVDRIAFGWDANKYPWGMVRSLATNYLKYRRRPQVDSHPGEAPSSTMHRILDPLMSYHPSKIHATMVQGLRSSGLKGDIPKIEYAPHHLAHAYSTYFCSPFQKAGILTLDGSGEETCTQLAVGEGEDVRVVESISIPHSLGWFYAAITEYLGFIPDRDEGKLMGLAAYGEVRKNQNKWLEPLSKVLRLDADGYEVDATYTKMGGHFYGSRFTDGLVKLLTGVDPAAEPIAYGEKTQINGEIVGRYLLDTYVDIAWAAQELLERAGVSLARKLMKETGVEDLCVAGGVGLNCKMNGEIRSQSGCRNLFVQPAAGDAGVALGAAMYVAKQNGEDVRNPLTHSYYGPEYSNGEIHEALTNCKIEFRTSTDPAGDGASLLEQGKIISWFQGRMEFGPRALGNRSILGNPAIAGMGDRVNKDVKYREPWRPFCPSMLEDVKDDYIDDASLAPFMIVAYRATDRLKQQLPSVVHTDDTIRPQTVTTESNPLFYELLEKLGERTGHPVVMNTSFNVRGEPIICAPLEAVRCFTSNGLDALIMGDFVLEKKS
jgi:carbamoyltransferase